MTLVTPKAESEAKVLKAIKKLVSTLCPARVQSPALYIKSSLCILIAKLGRAWGVPALPPENLAKCLKKGGFLLGFSLEDVSLGIRGEVSFEVFQDRICLNPALKLRQIPGVLRGPT